MKTPKFRVGEKIVLKERLENSRLDEVSDDRQPDGHVVFIMEPHTEDPLYYCSMYPGAESGFEYVYVFDMEMGGFEEDGTPATFNALNKYRESELEKYRP